MVNAFVVHSVRRSKREKFKSDPKLVAAARELRDRSIEQINAAPGPGGLPPCACGKYDVSRAPGAAPSAMRLQQIMEHSPDQPRVQKMKLPLATPQWR